MDKFDEALKETMSQYDVTLRKLAEGEPVFKEIPADDSEKKKDEEAK